MIARELKRQFNFYISNCSKYTARLRWRKIKFKEITGAQKFCLNWDLKFPLKIVSSKTGGQSYVPRLRDRKS